MLAFTRRQFLQLASGGTLLLAGCRTLEAPRQVDDSNPTSTPTTPVTASSEGEPSVEIDGELAIKIGQMFMVGFRGMNIDEAQSVVEDIRQRHLGGVVLFNYDVPRGDFVRNIASPEQVRALTEALQQAAEIPLLIATDQEGGVVVRLSEQFGFPPTHSHQELGQLDNVEQTYAHASEMARTLAEAGINQNLAPVVDVNVYPESPAIGAYGRSFSADPAEVIAHARAFIQAHHDAGLLCTLKHFPGHGSARTDSHRGFVDVSDTWSPIELEPYAVLIEERLADAVMTAHVFDSEWDTADPATLSPAVITGMLREQLGYDGVIVSDDMQMGAIREFYGFEDAIRKTILAGVDVIAIANNSIYDERVMARGVDVVKQLVTDSVISTERIDASYQRIMALKERLV